MLSNPESWALPSSPPLLKYGIILCPYCNYEVKDDDDVAEDIVPVDGNYDTPYLKAHRSCLME